MQGFNVGLNAVTSTNSLLKSSNVNALNNSGIDIQLVKQGTKLSLSTANELENPEPGSFMYVLNKGFGLVDIKC